MKKINFSLTQLEYVLAVHKYGHFANAAKACHVSQPTLSMQIQKFEDDLDVVVFDRTKKPILVTEMGRKIIDQIQLILHEAKKLDDIIAGEKDAGTRGELTMAVIPTVAPYLLPRLLPVLEREFPNINLKILEKQTEDIVDALENDEIDVGVLATPLKNEKLFEMSLYFEPFLVLAKKGQLFPEAKKVKYASLATDHLWLLEEGHCLRDQIMDLCAVKREKSNESRYKFASGSLETLKKLVDSYGGYTLLPQMAIDQGVGENSRVIPFERPIPAREIGLVYRREHYKAELIESLSEAILSAIPEEIRKLRERDLNVIPI